MIIAIALLFVLNCEAQDMHDIAESFNNIRVTTEYVGMDSVYRNKAIPVGIREREGENIFVFSHREHTIDTPRGIFHFRELAMTDCLLYSTPFSNSIIHVIVEKNKIYLFWKDLTTDVLYSDTYLIKDEKNESEEAKLNDPPIIDLFPELTGTN